MNGCAINGSEAGNQIGGASKATPYQEGSKGSAGDRQPSGPPIPALSAHQITTTVNQFGIITEEEEESGNGGGITTTSFGLTEGAGGPGGSSPWAAPPNDGWKEKAGDIKLRERSDQHLERKSPALTERQKTNLEDSKEWDTNESISHPKKSVRKALEAEEELKELRKLLRDLEETLDSLSYKNGSDSGEIKSLGAKVERAVHLVDDLVDGGCLKGLKS